jgi:preprotein translocase subunit SecB
MKIQLDKWHVTNLAFTNQIDESREYNAFDLSTGQIFPEDDEKSFLIDFHIVVKDKFFNLDLQCVFVFKLDEPITEEFKLGHFPKVNAPAIAFPYIRAYISNLTLQSGFNPVMLPSINFIKLNKDSE